MKCRSGEESFGSAIMGKILSADSLQPVPDVEVRLAWTTYTISKTSGIVKAEHLQADTTASQGTFKICGLPNSLEGNLEARVDGQLEAESRVSVPDSGTALIVKSLVLPVTEPGQLRPTASLTGTVPLPSGERARNATIAIWTKANLEMW
jgi:hypothetical protein